jgi:superfamily II DNA or RNA helicase
VNPFQLRNVDLRPWQQDAVQAWTNGDGRACHGTLEIVTGGGKTLIALACMEAAAHSTPNLRVAIVVPTTVLAQQWLDVLARHTHLKGHDVKILGAGHKGATFDTARVIVAVLNTASRVLPDLARDHQPAMLVVDECHRAGAPSHSKVLRTPAAYRLGLSATPDREELDEDGELLRYDEQLVGMSIGAVVYRFDLQQARKAGWLPDYELNHHGVTLAPDERTRYDALSRRVDDAIDALRDMGISPERARSVAGRQDAAGQTASMFVALTSERKDLLYRAQQRHRVVASILTPLLADPNKEPPRAILFHERVDEAVALHAQLSELFPSINVGLEHSKLSPNRRHAALDSFRSGDTPILVSVKSLIEGVDVPEADIGISVASTSSVRQRIQALGRVLRKPKDGSEKKSFMHLLYVDDSVDDAIYGKADWTDLTGADRNRYWRWPLDGAVEHQDGPPRSPLPTEEQAWNLLDRQVTDPPSRWPGVVVGQEYTVSTNGTVHNAFRRLISNPQRVADMVASVRGRPGGRFRVTPEFHLVLIWKGGPDDPGEPYVAGQLAQPFAVEPEVTEEETASLDLSTLCPGDRFPGPSDRSGGSFKMSRKSGGQIERPMRGGGNEWALATAPDDDPRIQAARALLAAWRYLDQPISRVHRNGLGHIWYEEQGQRKYLGYAPLGFRWPTEDGEEEDEDLARGITKQSEKGREILGGD